MNPESNQNDYYHNHNAYNSYWSCGSDYTTSSNESSESTSPQVDTSNPIRNPYYNYFMCSPSLYNQYMPHLRDVNQIATKESFQQQVQLMPTSTPLSSRHRQSRQSSQPILDINTVHEHFGKFMPISLCILITIDFTFWKTNRIRNIATHQCRAIVKWVETSHAYIVHNGPTASIATYLWTEHLSVKRLDWQALNSDERVRINYSGKIYPLATRNFVPVQQYPTRNVFFYFVDMVQEYACQKEETRLQKLNFCFYKFLFESFSIVFLYFILFFIQSPINNLKI